MKAFQLFIRYLKFWFSSKTKFSIHSPFVFQLVTEVIGIDKEYYAFKKIEGVRTMLLKNQEYIEITDFGAGSQINSSNKRKICDIAKNSAKREKLGKILFRIVEHFQPKTMLELGTSLGMSSLYQYSAGPQGKRYITMEGCPQTAGVAKRVFDSYGARDIEIVTGDFAKTLSPTIDGIHQLDYAFFDGNHQKQPTIDYFEAALKKAHEGSVFIFDDIHWSAGMEEAWEHIKQHPRVKVTVDLFWIGLVFFKTDQEEEHFKVRV